VGKTSGVIDINGTDYDIASGRVIGAVRRVAGQVKMPNSAQVIDGFIKNKRHIDTPKAKLADIPAVKKMRTRKISDRAAKVAATAIHHRREHSKTLMRSRLGRPALKVKEASRTFTSHSPVAESVRAARAKVISTHAKVSRFGNPGNSSTANRPKTGGVINAIARPLNRAEAASAPATTMSASASHAKLERLLDRALFQADAHKQARQRHSLSRFSKLWAIPRWLRITLLAIILLSVIGWVIYRDMPAVAVKVAAERAHVSASLPAYTPSGFSYAAPIGYQNGSVTVSFKNKAGPTSSYSITQQKSDWDSASLAANAIGPKTEVQTSQIGGTTVYIYGNSNNATWVNNGIHYTLSNKAGLSSDQVLKIVQSF